ncbi:MAG: hypothetical protein QM535_22340, partial [Limnohabitans sp.]|nr:hypothetical protein [Limnohabitans sp.]
NYDYDDIKKIMNIGKKFSIKFDDLSLSIDNNDKLDYICNNFHDLRELDLSITANGININQLSKLKKLRELVIFNRKNKIKIIGLLDVLNHLPYLTRLCLNDFDLENDFWNQLPKIKPNLQYLTVRNLKDEKAMKLANLSYLKELCLKKSSITDKTVKVLLNITKIKSFVTEGCLNLTELTFKYFVVKAKENPNVNYNLVSNGSIDRNHTNRCLKYVKNLFERLFGNDWRNDIPKNLKFQEYKL